jgi:hypothetical protein
MSNRLRVVLGIVAGVILVGSSAAHSLLGWKQLGAALASAGAAPDLITGLGIGWHFAGVAMLTLGVIVIRLFADLRRRHVSLWPGLIIAVVYLAFGAWALAVSDMNPFFLIFIVPGLLLLLASWGRPAGAPLAAPDRH